MSLKVVADTSKACPSCGMAIDKSEGCNKMTCAYCGTFFCWKCGQTVRDYSHFKEGSACNLFDQDQIDAWNMLVNGFVPPEGGLKRCGRDSGAWRRQMAVRACATAPYVDKQI